MTILIIAHRLTTIESANNLLFFKSRSHLVSAAKGTHEYNEIFERLKCISYAAGNTDEKEDSSSSSEEKEDEELELEEIHEEAQENDEVIEPGSVNSLQNDDVKSTHSSQSGDMIQAIEKKLSEEGNNRQRTINASRALTEVRMSDKTVEEEMEEPLLPVRTASPTARHLTDRKVSVSSDKFRKQSTR